MPSYTYQMIYIGDLTDMDTNENNNTVEGVGAVMGGQTYGSTGDPLFARSMQVTLNDNAGSGNVVSLDHYQPSNSNPDTISYELNGQSYELELDHTIRVRNVTVVQATGPNTTQTITVPVRLIQDENGNTFIMPPPTSGSEPGEPALTDYPIIFYHAILT